MTSETRTTRRAPTQARSAKRVGLVLDAARALLQEHDPAEVTIRAVAERAGTSPASVYRYFDDVDQVIDVLLTEHATEAEQAVAAALDHSRARTVAGVFELVVRTYLDLYDRRPELTVVWRSPALADRQRAVEERSDAGLAVAVGTHLVSRGLLSALTPAVETRLIAHWTTAGALLGVVLRTAGDERAALEAELVALVRWFAGRY